MECSTNNFCGKVSCFSNHVCTFTPVSQISQRYGILRVDAKIAADSVFEALGKPLPEPLPPDEKVAPPAKGKKGKDTKKGQHIMCSTMILLMLSYKKSTLIGNWAHTSVDVLYGCVFICSFCFISGKALSRKTSSSRA